MTEIRDIDDFELAIPLLVDLRSSLTKAIFMARLSAAIKHGYRVLGASQNNDDLVGVLGYRITRDICWGCTLYIDDLNVAPDARGSGIGKALLDAAKARAAELNCDHIRLCSGLTRTDAHRFYEANDLQGFSKQFVLSLKEG